MAIRINNDQFKVAKISVDGHHKLILYDNEYMRSDHAVFHWNEKPTTVTNMWTWTEFTAPRWSGARHFHPHRPLYVAYRKGLKLIVMIHEGEKKIIVSFGKPEHMDFYIGLRNKEGYKLCEEKE